jgi:electron transport complex protein RnfB
MSLVDTLNALLPQTQCKECQYPGCKPYAIAMAAKLAPINRCAPGGIETLRALGNALNIDATPFETEMLEKTRPPSTMIIDEKECIGCTKCIQACPVDAIVGAAKRMHTILKTECTGCGLCIEACPVDCIETEVLDKPLYDKARAQQQFEQKSIRNIKAKQQSRQQYQTQTTDTVDKKAFILDAIKRSQQKKT